MTADNVAIPFGEIKNVRSPLEDSTYTQFGPFFLDFGAFYIARDIFHLHISNSKAKE